MSDEQHLGGNTKIDTQNVSLLARFDPNKIWDIGTDISNMIMSFLVLALQLLVTNIINKKLAFQGQAGNGTWCQSG